MKHYRKAAALLMASCLAAPAMGTMNAEAAQELSTAAVSEIKPGLNVVNGKRYYYSNGKALKNRLKTVGTRTYYFGPDGAAKTGWYTIGGNSYYFNSKGVLQSKYTKTIDKTLVKKMDQIISSQKITYRTSASTAMARLYRYMRDKCRYDRVIGFKAEKGWDAVYARKMLMNKKGSCYHFAAGYAYLVKRATGLPVRIALGQTNAFNAKVWQNHAWCEVKINGVWYTFDPNVAWAKKVNPSNVRLSSNLCYKQKQKFMLDEVYRKVPGTRGIQYVEVKL